MTKLLLTSVGIPATHKKIRKAFLDMLPKKPAECRVAFIPTAARTVEERDYTEISWDQLVECGIKAENINTLELDRICIKSDTLADYDVLFVCGGNTFYLLHCAVLSGFTDAIRNFNGMYVGVSAGSILVGPSIEIARPWDANDIGLDDPTGINLVPFSVSPHYVETDEKLVQSIEKTTVHEIVRLTDTQAILMDGGVRTLIDD